MIKCEDCENVYPKKVLWKFNYNGEDKLVELDVQGSSYNFKKATKEFLDNETMGNSNNKEDFDLVHELITDGKMICKNCGSERIFDY